MNPGGGFNPTEIYTCVDCGGKYTGVSIEAHLIEEFLKKPKGDVIPWPLFRP